jgi:formylglycine-generating enzyme required for sulfatase activity
MNQKSLITTAAEIAGIIGVVLAYLAFANQMGWAPFETRSTPTPNFSASAATPIAIATLAPTAASAPTNTMLPTAPIPFPPTDTPRPLATITPQPTDTPRPTATLTPKPTDTPRPTATPTLGIGSTQVALIDGAPMVYVPAGEFVMGSNDHDDEKPPHTVYLDAFWMDKFEVTNALYKKCVDAGKCATPSERKSNTRATYYGTSPFDNFPVIYVSWNDARAFCAWAGKRLPTEAEWEKSARGPATSANNPRIFPWGNAFDKTLLNSAEGGKRDTTAIGSYPTGASLYGALDLAGNVWEWTADWYDATYYKTSPTRNPRNDAAGQQRVLRGGSWYDQQSFVRAASRISYLPDQRYPDVGFRCAQ